MSTRLHESVGSLPAEPLGDGLFDVTVIKPGWGSSGYYSEAMLREHGPKVFTRGVAMFANHPTEEEFSRGRDVTKIMAKIHEDARWEDGKLKAKIKVGAPYREFVEEYMETIGLSIFVEGNGVRGEAEGRSGFIVESLSENDPYRSLDFVVAAGAGGGVNEKIIESFRAAEAVARQASADEAENGAAPAGRRTEEKESSMDIEEIGKKVDALAESVSAFIAQATPLLENLKPAETPDEVDIATVVESVVDANLPKGSRKVVLEAIKNGGAIEDAIKEEKARVDEIRKELSESVKGGQVTGRVVEAGGTQFSLKGLVGA